MEAGKRIETYRNKYRKYVNYVDKYRGAKNAASGSEFDSNANVENKNVVTCSGEIDKGDQIGINRLMMIDKITELFGEELAEEYIRQLESHELYRHDETHPLLPYCVSITLYPFLFHGTTNIGGNSEAPKHLDSFCGSFVNLVYAVAAQFAGAVATPEFLMYMDYFIRKDYGDDYYEHTDRIAELKAVPKTIEDVIDAKLQQVIYSINEPAGARNFQSVFWNLAYFDKPYFDGMFEDFVFPDGTAPNWDSVNWLQKKFMKWFNAERLKKILTFPVETVNLLNDGKDYADQEWKDYTAQMWSEGASFFCYTSNSVDSLASCCFDGKQMCLSKSSNGVNYMTFEELYDTPYPEKKQNFRIFHNGSWVAGKVIRLPKRPMYKIVTQNGKELFVTDNHVFPTLDGDKEVKTLTVNDHLMFNCRKLEVLPEHDNRFTYEQGYLVGMDIGCESADASGSFPCEKELDMNCLLQSYDFRRGILDGHYMANGKNDNCLRMTSEKLCHEFETLITSLGMNSAIDVSDKVFRIRWYEPRNKRSSTTAGFIARNNCEYFKIKSIEQYESSDEYVYCFEMSNEDEPYFTLPNGVISHNCRLRNEMTENTFSYTLGAGGISTGSKGVLTLNLNRLVQNVARAKGGKENVNYSDISAAVSEQVEKMHKYLFAYNELVKENFKAHMLPVYDAGYISLEKQYLTLGINGFVESAEFFGIEPTVNDKYMEYGEAILKPIYDLNHRDRTKEIMFNTEFVPAENLGVKNAKWDKKDGYEVPRDCYNSYFYRVEDEGTSVLDKFILHGSRFTKYLDGGSALHNNLSEHLSKDQYLNLMNVAIKTGCSYFTFNIPNTICNDCGHISKHRLSECPVCHSKNLDYATRVIGYLKRVSKFSEPRQEEEGKRFYE